MQTTASEAATQPLGLAGTSKLRIGISPFASTRAGALAVATLAIEGGIDTLWMGDGLLANEDFPRWAGAMEPFTELAWLAGRFPTATVGVTAAVLPQRDIVWTAKQALTLDHLTEGRFILAVAAGFWAHELTFRGVDPEQRGARFRDGVRAVRAVFDGRGHTGESGDIPDTGAVGPLPRQAGGPPLWLAGAEATARFALREGLPFQISRIGPDELAPFARRWFDEGGTTLAVRVRLSVAQHVPDGTGVAWNALVGPPDYLAEQLDRYRRLGVSDLSIVPGQDDAGSLATVEALVDDILPALGPLASQP